MNIQRLNQLKTKFEYITFSIQSPGNTAENEVDKRNKLHGIYSDLLKLSAGFINSDYHAECRNQNNNFENIKTQVLIRAMSELLKMIDTSSRPAKHKTKEKLLFTIPLNNPKIRADLLKCKKAGILSWDEKGRPDFISRVWLMALRDYWYYTDTGVEQIYNLKYKWDGLKNTFLVNGEKPKLGAYFLTSTEYYDNIPRVKEQLINDILKLSISEIKILLSTNFSPT